MFPLFACEVMRARRSEWRRCMLAFAAPIALIGAVAAWHNQARFADPTEFGHRYLDVVQQQQIERHGLFDTRYLARNLSVVLAGVPEVSADPPHLRIGGHGLALWITTPAFLLLLRARSRGPLTRELWITVACVAPFTLAYQNTGWIQFGQRFSLDYTVFLVLLLAAGAPPLGRMARGLIAVGIAVNLFGAVTFGRYPHFYRTDAATYRAGPFGESSSSQSTR
jgi:hypothetical protein